MIDPRRLAEVLGPLLLNPDAPREASPFNDIVIDSRKVTPGALFVALRGEQTDGHRFLADAVERGATGLLTRMTPPDLPARAGVFLVEDTRLALQQAAKRWRASRAARVIGITGSVGKTTTREAVADVLRSRYETLESPRNFNSDIGLPLALLGLAPSHEWAVVEMGPYDRCEMELLVDVGAPDIGIVTNVGPTHLERFGSIEATEQIKGLLPASLPPDGVAILNGDDARVRRMRARTSARTLLFGLGDDVDVRATDVVSHGLDGIAFTLHLPGAAQPIAVRTPLAGAHHAMTALAAAAVAHVAGLSPSDTAEALSRLHAGSRLKPRRGYSGATILDDTYNAAPLSMRAALDLLAGMAGHRIAVLGDMLELGQEEAASHRAVGEYAVGRCDRLIAIGRRARGITDGAWDAGHRHIQWFADKDEAGELLRNEVGADDVVLVKASHGLALETVVKGLITPPRTGAAARRDEWRVERRVERRGAPVMTAFSLATAGIAFVLALAIGRPLLALLRRRAIGKAISDEGPDSHHIKAGTPTMGGLIDDLGTLQGRVQWGLSWRLKIVLLLLFALGAALTLFYGLDTKSINIPWAGQYSLGEFYIPIAVLVILATTTSVAITDGMDALAGGTLAIAFAAYGVIAVGQEQDFLVRFAFTTVGATLGFLWFNAHPAQIFMGDTGALALGGTLAIVALMTGHWLLLPIIGIVFVLEAGSDIVQIGYFKLTGGRRVLRMAPLHNHFELLGWSEPQVVTRAWLVGIAGAILGVALALQV